MSGTGIDVRRARPADRPALVALRSALASPTRGLLAPALERSGTIDGGPVALVATPGVGDRAAIGYVLAVPGPTDASPAVVTVAELAVAPAARRAGVGTALIEAVAARSGSHDRIRVTTPASDDRALAFYRALGFEQRDRLDGHYRGEDAVRLDRPVETRGGAAPRGDEARGDEATGGGSDTRGRGGAGQGDPRSRRRNG